MREALARARRSGELESATEYRAGLHTTCFSGYSDESSLLHRARSFRTYERVRTTPKELRVFACESASSGSSCFRAAAAVDSPVGIPFTELVAMADESLATAE